MSKELRELDLPHGGEEPNVGAPRIHGEQEMLGFSISERTVLGWMGKAPRTPGPERTCRAILSNHSEDIVAMNFSTVADPGTIDTFWPRKY